jgi:predicted ABC-type ATPase
MSKLYIIAGPNGAGKTTFAKEFLPHYAKCPNFVNADLIASGLSPFSPSAVNIKAGKLLLGQVKEFIHQKADFAFESTLSGRSYVSLIKDVKRKGYSVTIFFLWIPDVKLARERIKQRVKAGGHDVPFEDVKRRFQRSRVNFLKLYGPLCDSWILFDNASGKPKEIVQKDRGGVKILNKEYYSWFTGER